MHAAASGASSAFEQLMLKLLQVFWAISSECRLGSGDGAEGVRGDYH